MNQENNTIKTVKALFVGLCTKDILYYTDELPTLNHKAKTEEFASYIGGPAANAAITYAVLGGDATLATCLGSSAESRAMEEELQKYGVMVLNFSTAESIPNTAAIVVASDGKRTILSGQHKFVVDRAYDIAPYDFVLFDCNQQEISLDLLKRTEGKTVVLDAGSVKPNIEKFLERADIVIASEDFKDADGRDLFGMQCSAEHQVITRGERPMLYRGKELPVTSVRVVDTLGAGDIFHGAFCYGYFEKKFGCEEALLFAADVAGESVKYRGPREWISHAR